jgi:hypothetical protein
VWQTAKKASLLGLLAKREELVPLIVVFWRILVFYLLLFIYRSLWWVLTSLWLIHPVVLVGPVASFWSSLVVAAVFWLVFGWWSLVI